MADLDMYQKQLYDFIQNNSNCYDNEILKVVDLFKRKELSPNDHYFHAGNGNNSVGFLCSGILRAYLADEEGNENNLFFFMENDFVIGNLSPGSKCLFNIQSLTEAIVLKADLVKYADLINQNYELRTFNDVTIQNIHVKMGKRVAKDFFDNAKEKYETFLRDYPGLLNRIPHYYVANYLGITPTQLSRVRKDLIQ